MAESNIGATMDELLLAALERGGDTSQTGRYIITFKEGGLETGVRNLQSKHSFQMADARDFAEQAVSLQDAAQVDVLSFPEIGVALMSGEAAATRNLMTAEAADDESVQSIDPEYFVFSSGVNPRDYLRGAMRALEMVQADLAEDEEQQEPGTGAGSGAPAPQPLVAGVTWGLTAVKVPPSRFDGSGIRVAILDTGFDLGHPDFAGRPIVSATFAGQPVMDLHGHGTHTAGTACGPLAPSGAIPRYGVAHRALMYIGKVLNNSGGGTQAQSLAGINWAIANRCAVISMSLGAAGSPVQPSYTNAGAAAMANGCLIIAAAGNSSNRPAVINGAGAPANSPTVLSVASITSAMQVSSFSDGQKVDIAGPGSGIYSSYKRPAAHTTLSGTSMATPHVSGCAALWAQSSPALRGAALRARLLATARALPFPASDVGSGLVQAP